MLARVLEKLAVASLPAIERLRYRRFTNYPFGESPRADASEYTALWEQARSQPWTEIDEAEARLGHAIDRDWMEQLALRTQVVVKDSQICYQHGRLLYSFLRQYLGGNDTAAIRILETGTARGFSSLCMARALADANRDGTIVTFDVLPHDTPMYWNCIADAEGPMSRRELLAGYADLVSRYVLFHQGDSRLELGKLKFDRINFAFLDGAHTYEDVMFEFDAVGPYQQPGDVIFFDDYTPRLFPGIVQGVDEICSKFGYDKHVLAIDESRGYAVATRRS